MRRWRDVLDSLLHNPSPSPFCLPLVWHPPLHSPCISLPNHCLLFTTHAHTIATSFAVVPRLCHSIIVSLSSLYLELSFTLTSHIHLSIVISACWNVISCSFLTGQVSIPCNILLLYSLLLITNDISLLVSNGTNCLNLFHPADATATHYLLLQ